MKLTVRKLSFALLIAGFAVTAGQPTPVLADAPSRVVRYDDLNLASLQGRTVLDRRINSAVSQVCNDPGARDLQQLVIQRACRRQARANAEAQLLKTGRHDLAQANVERHDN